MPSRLPHGLKRSPFDMSWGEKGVFGLLTVSIGAGIYRLLTDPWSEKPIKNNLRNERDHRGGLPQVTEEIHHLSAAKRHGEDGLPNVHDDITDIQFGDPK